MDSQNDMTGSILNDVKKLIGFDQAYTNFDADICFHINGALATLCQLGVVSPSDLVPIVDDSTRWEEIIPDHYRLAMAKSYVYLKTKLQFDPPTSGTLADAMQRQIDEYEWRAMIAAQYPN